MSIDDDAQRAELRREVLRETLVAIAPRSTWITDDRFEHYPLDVQAVAQIVQEQCAEQMKNCEADLTKKWKVAHEKELRSLTDRCMKDKQAIRLEAEADKKALGLEIARVKKRLIEVERDKHQATCQSAQSQRDARNWKKQLEEGESKITDLTIALKKKTDGMQEMEKLALKQKKQTEREKQKLEENLHTLEAKLNNQETTWSDRCNEILKESERDKQRQVLEVRDQMLDQCKDKVEERLGHFWKKFENILRHQPQATEQLNSLSDQLLAVLDQLSGSQQTQSDRVKEHGRLVLAMLSEVIAECQTLTTVSKRFGQVHADVKLLLKTAGVFSIHEATDKIQALQKSLREVTEHNSQQNDLIFKQKQEIAKQHQTLSQFEVLQQNLQSEITDLQSQLKEKTEMLKESVQNSEQTERRCSMLERAESDYKEQIASLSTQCEQAATERSLAEEKHDALRSELQRLIDNHTAELDSLKHLKKEEYLTFMRKMRVKYFDVPDSVLSGLRQSMEDMTTQSCIRSLKLSEQLRSSGISRKRMHSAVQSIMTSTHSNFDTLIHKAELESLHIDLAQKSRNYQKLDATETPTEPSTLDESDKELFDFECVLFWLVLTARISQDQLSERTAQNGDGSGKGNAQEPRMRFSLDRLKSTRRLMRVRPKNHQKEERNQTQASSMKDTAQNSEAAEIEQIIETLKAYLKSFRPTAESANCTL